MYFKKSFISIGCCLCLSSLAGLAVAPEGRWCRRIRYSPVTGRLPPARSGVWPCPRDSARNNLAGRSTHQCPGIRPSSGQLWRDQIWMNKSELHYICFPTLSQPIWLCLIRSVKDDMSFILNIVFLLFLQQSMLTFEIRVSWADLICPDWNVIEDHKCFAVNWLLRFLLFFCSLVK